MNNGDHKKVLLVVDDTPAYIRLVNSLLGAEYDIRVATNGAMALEAIRASAAPDLILLDVRMPGMDGYEVCARLKAEPKTCDTPVIFLTGQTEIADEQKGFAVGAVDYILKPFSEGIIKARVRTHLALQEVRQQLALQLRTLTAELEMARLVQLSILPREMPKIEGLDIAARYVPMTSVAGDFYDFIIVDEKRIGMLIADVSGHGMSAALIASMLKISLAAQSVHASEPEKVLWGLNETLCGMFHEHYVTAAYVFVNLADKTLRYAGAGHPPLLLCDGASGNSRVVEENGLVLSWFPEAKYTQIELPLSTGDWIVLYTDGVTETKNCSGEEFGIHHLQEFVENYRNHSAGKFANQLLGELSRWRARSAGGEPRDDVSFLVVHVDDAGADSAT
jgi:serine phosphatase RsbU (regulator of sigma subunit)